MLTNIPFSFSVHAHEVQYEYGHVPIALERAEFAAFCNGAAMERLLGRLPPGARSNSRLVYHGVDLTQFSYLAFPRSTGPFRILSAGRLTHTKGFDRLIHACAIAKTQGVPIELTILGTGPIEGELVDLAGIAGLSDQVHLPGWVSHSQVAEYLHDSHLFALAADTNYDDGLPNVVLEAMACGRPVLLSPLPAATEAVSQGVEGIIVRSADDVEAFAESIVHLHEERSEAEEMGKAARYGVEEKFNAAASIRCLRNLMVGL